ncbi:MAG: hypothetical protein RMK92_06565 [Armatimonadota bacterium]|nr:hypothetical protein [Armatimonadota bacterium]
MRTSWWLKQLHPHIRALVSKTEVSHGDTEPLDMQASCFALFFGSTLVFFLMAFLRYQDALSAVLLLASVGATVGALLYLERAWQQVLAERWNRALTGLLRKSGERGAQRAYLQLLLDLMESRHLDESFLRSLLEQANGLLDCALQLEGYRQQLASPALTSLNESRQRLQAKLEQSEDPVARRAIEDSLRLLDERIQARQQVSLYLQRVDALQELVLQMFGALHESLTRLKTFPLQPEQVDTHSLYERLSGIQQETRALAQALQEMYQLEQG